MAWGDKTITRKFLRYAEAYVSWGTFIEVMRVSPRTIAIRVDAPFFTGSEAYLDGPGWWLGPENNPTAPHLGNLNFLGSIDAYEADIAVAISRIYLSELSLALGSENRALVNFGMKAVDDGNNEARREAFKAVLNYLFLIVQGIGHREHRTQKLAYQLLQDAEQTFQEIKLAQQPKAPDANAETATNLSVRSSEKDTSQDGAQIDANFWDQEEAARKRANATAFEALPIAHLCRELGIVPDFGSSWEYSPEASHGSGRGLQIGSEGMYHAVFLTSSDDRWYLSVARIYAVSGEPVHEIESSWSLCGTDADPAHVADLVGRALRNLSEQVAEALPKNALLAALFAWGHLNHQPGYSAWATDEIQFLIPDGFAFPSNYDSLAQLLIEGPFATDEEKSILKRWINYTPLPD